MTFWEAADRESGLCYNIGVQVNLLFDCPKKGASMKQSSNKKSREATAFLYERLSRDDNLEGESYSIGNQKKLLTKVAKEKGYTNLVHFLDDGISGVTMNRPGFVEMMQQLEQGKAAAVFVKDLSRLGRNYIEVGRLTEEFFPDHDIRLVAVSDNIDTAEGENELAPIRNLFNEWYARDISKKRRISNKIKGNSGEPMGLPPYGYIKDPNNPKHWVIDEEAAQVVRRIFDMTLEGFGTEQIATQFEKEGILTPQAYWIQKGIGRPGRSKTRPATKWNGSTITHLLYQQEYCGDVLNFKPTLSPTRTRSGFITTRKIGWCSKMFTNPLLNVPCLNRYSRSVERCANAVPATENTICSLAYLSVQTAAAICTSTSIRATRKSSISTALTTRATVAPANPPTTSG